MTNKGTLLFHNTDRAMRDDDALKELNRVRNNIFRNDLVATNVDEVLKDFVFVQQGLFGTQRVTPAHLDANAFASQNSQGDRSPTSVNTLKPHSTSRFAIDFHDHRPMSLNEGTITRTVHGKSKDTTKFKKQVNFPLELVHEIVRNGYPCLVEEYAICSALFCSNAGFLSQGKILVYQKTGHVNSK